MLWHPVIAKPLTSPSTFLEIISIENNVAHCAVSQGQSVFWSPLSIGPVGGGGGGVYVGWSLTNLL